MLSDNRRGMNKQSLCVFSFFLSSQLKNKFVSNQPLQETFSFRFFFTEANTTPKKKSV